MSGFGHNFYYTQSTGSSAVDGVLGDTAWADGTIYYSVPRNVFEYSNSYSQGEHQAFFPTNNTQGVVIDFALDTGPGPAANDGFSVEGFTQLNVEYTTSAYATIRVNQTTLDPYNYGTAWGFFPSSDENAGDVWFTNANFDFSTPVTGNYAYLTVIHEIGHALGLQHGHEDSAFGMIPSEFDTMEYSIMTYRSYEGSATGNGYQNETWGHAQTWMMLDIAALQHMYGADYSTNSGDTVYSWSPGSGDTVVNGTAGVTPGDNRIFATIWDGGGTDTYDLSAYSDDLSIDLAPGSYSLFSQDQLAGLGDGNLASANIYNALLYRGDTRSLIENATGGTGNDHISGNSANNTLIGNGGNDRLLGGAGNDLLGGYGGRDVLLGGSGSDRLFGGNSRDRLQGNSGTDEISGGAGNDLLLGAKGNDQLFGQVGNDILKGGGGRDTLVGGAGSDRLTGGGGRDTFLFNAVSDSAAGRGFDQITDFRSGADQIDISALVGQALAISLGGSFSGSRASVITREVGGDTRVLIDTDQDRQADMRIDLLGTTGLSESDFIL